MPKFGPNGCRLLTDVGCIGTAPAIFANSRKLLNMPNEAAPNQPAPKQPERANAERPKITPRLNDHAYAIVESCLRKRSELRLGYRILPNGAQIVDFGVETRGGLQAGIELAEICLGGRGSVSISTPSVAHSSDGQTYPIIQVQTDDPLHACMFSQYAGWPVKGEEFFAMGSGPMRAKRLKEHLLEAFRPNDSSAFAVGVLECDKLPGEEIANLVAAECNTTAENVVLCVAPTRSIAGTLQVVARSVETCLHKLFELGYDLNNVVSAMGWAPLPPPASDFAAGIGRTNDAILYGGCVTLWLEDEDAAITSVGPNVPSSNSKDFGRPFADIFKDYAYDFYKVDPGLFSPAQLTMINLTTGRSWTWGKTRPDILRQSFGEAIF